MLRFIFLVSILFAFQFIEAQPSLSLDQYVSGFTRPVKIANAGDDRLFVVEQSGVIKIIDNTGTVLATPFLDITARVQSSGNEQGLLGLAFPPNYAETGHFYVNYTYGNGSGRTRISRFSIDPGNPNLALLGSEEELVDYDQPFTNHNGGDLNFGPEGYLYISSGDGGLANDPSGNGQNKNSFLGKILRIDVDTAASYRIPTDNPFFGVPNRKQQIWSLGLRNPWRFSFDRLTGDMWIGDVGQGDLEEVDFEAAGTAGGENYGWDCYEGTDEFEIGGCNEVYTFPIFEYPHSSSTGGYSITGGFVYRGMSYPELKGDYIFCDYVSNNFWVTSVNDTTGDFDTYRQNDVGFSISTFGEDADGELYAASLSNGGIYRVTGGCPEIVYTTTISEVGDSLVADRIYGQFQWFLDGMPIVGANQYHYTPEEDGDYTLEVLLNVKGCHYTASSNVIVVSEDCNFPACVVSITLMNDTIFSTCGGGEYTWLLDDAAIDSIGPAEDYIIPFATGTYQLAIYDSVSPGCIRIDTSNEIAYVVNSVEPQEVEIIHLFPNPATDEVQLYIQGSVSELELFDVEGKVHTANWKILSGNITIPVDQLPTGYYFVRMVSDDKVYAGSFMKE